MTVRETILCDQCGNEITNKADHINARVYGVDFHLSCLVQISALRLMKLLELDEIKDMNNDKFIYTHGFKRLLDGERLLNGETCYT